MVKILTVPERIKLFKEINEVHKEMFGWKMMYWNPWGKAGYIDIERCTWEINNDWAPISKSELEDFCFHNDKGRDITSLQGLFAWQAYYFHHVNPYKYQNYYSIKPFETRNLSEEDIVSNAIGKRIKTDVSHPVECLETFIIVQQRKDDGQIWISSSWLYHLDCYSSVASFSNDILKTLNEATGGDEYQTQALWNKYDEVSDRDRQEFERAIKNYYRGGKLKGKCWDAGYLFAASREWRIKTFEQLNAALKVEDKQFSTKLEEFIGWLRDNGLSLGDHAEESLRVRLKKFYDAYPREMAKDLCWHLVEEDRANPSDIYLWWGGEPEDFPCYAFLTIFFEVDPIDIGTHKFDENVAKNLKALVNISERAQSVLSYYKEIKPHVWRAIFS